MNYLLDTHAFIWWITGSDLMPATMAEWLSQASGAIWISVASLWEMSIKIRLGKLKMPEPFDNYVLRQIHMNRLEILPIHAPHVFGTMKLPMHHRDPFDRLLIAQASIEKLTLISQDEALRAYDVPMIWK
jgi:PIN domain nuclease of toxin-antitoxin system